MNQLASQRRPWAKDELKTFFRKKKVLITVGPTREYLDPVRFISNGSSGKVGLAIAKMFRSLGAKVFLVCGPGVSPPLNIKAFSVVSAREMLQRSEKIFFRSDFFVACAAVSDYRPGKISSKKIHKEAQSFHLHLVRNPDILACLAGKKTKQFCVGFALEDSDGMKNAIRKLKQKNCDLMVLNSVDSMESDFINAAIIFSTGRVWKLGKISKNKFAEKLCRAIVQSILKSA